LSNFHV
jgi:hypothetical protein